MAAPGDFDLEIAGDPRLRGLGAVGGRLSVRGNAPISAVDDVKLADVSLAFAAALVDNSLDLRKSRAEEARGDDPLPRDDIDDERLSFLFFCKISKAAFNSLAPPVKFFRLSVRGESCKCGFEPGRRLPRSSSSSSGWGAFR